MHRISKTYTFELTNLRTVNHRTNEYSEQRAFRVEPCISAFLCNKRNKWNVKLTKEPSNLREIHVLLNSEKLNYL